MSNFWGRLKFSHYLNKAQGARDDYDASVLLDMAREAAGADPSQLTRVANTAMARAEKTKDHKLAIAMIADAISDVKNDPTQLEQISARALKLSFRMPDHDDCSLALALAFNAAADNPRQYSTVFDTTLMMVLEAKDPLMSMVLLQTAKLFTDGSSEQTAKLADTSAQRHTRLAL